MKSSCPEQKCLAWKRGECTFNYLVMMAVSDDGRATHVNVRGPEILKKKPREGRIRVLDGRGREWYAHKKHVLKISDCRKSSTARIYLLRGASQIR